MKDTTVYEGETFAVVGALVDELVRVGVEAAVVSPGSRSTPVALVIARRPELRLYVHPDERSAAYFALGLAKASGRPALLLCTSGTAAANYLPALVEARYARVPLVVLTADRPPEQRDVGASQTIDQVRIFGSHVKASTDLPPPAPLAPVARYARIAAVRAAALALTAPMGPVHLNIPLREPLVPRIDAGEVAPGDGDAWAGRPDGAPYARIETAARVVDRVGARGDAQALAASARGLLVCGPEPGDGPAAARGRARAAARLAARLGWPLVADPLSAARTAGGAVTCHDAFLRDPATARRLVPDRVVRVGAPPVSKVLGQLIEAAPSGALWLVDEAGGYADPSLRAGRIVVADPARWMAAVGAAAPAQSAPSAWRTAWLEADRRAAGAVAQAMSEESGPGLFEGRVFHELGEVLAPHTTIVLGNSMPVRDADAFLRPRARGVRILGNRGTAGIDGLVSTALGASAADPSRPVLLAVGDLSFFHDLNGLLAARRFALSLTVLVLNNDGGGIFSFLPQAAHGEQFETLFGTPLGLDFAPAVRMHGGTFARVAGWPGLRRAVRRGLAAPGLHVVEVPCPDRGENVRLHDAVWRRVAQAQAGAGV